MEWDLQEAPLRLSMDPVLAAFIFICAKMTSVGPLKLNTTVPFSPPLEGAPELPRLGPPVGQ